ncbi:MAG: hypothetical protein AB3N15_01280 [Paracoccaceae bacterium]
MTETSKSTIPERIDKLERCVSDCAQTTNPVLSARLAEMRAALDAAMSYNDEPVQTVVTLNRLHAALSALRDAMATSGGDRAACLALAHETEAEVLREVSERSRAIWRFIDEKLRGDTRTTLRQTSDTAYLGPALVDTALLRLHIKTRPTGGPAAGIDDLAATCGIWICNPFGDTCLCTEWECSGDGPSGSFP